MGVKAWITVNGNHIPIMDGESKMQAVGRFIKGKRHGAAIRMKEMDRELSGDLPHTTRDIYNKYNKEAVTYQKYGGGTNIKGRAKTREGIINSLDKDEMIDLNNKKIVGPQPSYTKVTKGKFKGYYRNVYNNNDPYIDKDLLMREMKNYDSNQIRNRKTREAKPIETYDGRYKLKADRIKKTPVSSINVDTTSFRGAHGKEPGNNRVGGSTSGNWAFKLGNETIFINDTYANAKRKAIKEASRRGLWSIKVLS